MLEVVLDLEAVGGEVVWAVVLAGEVVEAVEKLDGRAGTGEVRGNGEDEVDEGAAERSEMLRRLAFAPKRHETVLQQREQADRGAVGHEGRGLVVGVDLVVGKLVAVAVGGGVVEELAQFPVHQLAVDADVGLLVDFGGEDGGVFAGDVGIGVDEGAVGRVAGGNVVVDKVELGGHGGRQKMGDGRWEMGGRRLEESDRSL